MENKKHNKVPFFLFVLYWIKNKLFSKVALRRILVLIFNLILLLFITIMLLMYAPVFQTLIAQLLTRYLSKEVGLEIKIDKVSIDLFHNVHLVNLAIKDNKKDTMIYLKDLDVDIQYSSIVHQKLIVRKILLNEPVIHIVRYKNQKTFNYEKLLDYFTSDDTMPSKDTSEFEFELKSIELRDAQFSYKDEKYNTKISSQINFDHIKLTRLNLLIDYLKQKKDTVYFQIKHLSATEQSGFNLKKWHSNVRITKENILFKDLFFNTSRSTYTGHLMLSYPSFDKLIEDPIKNLYIDADIHSPTKIHFADLYHFAKELKGWDNFVELSGHVKGKIPDLNISQAHLNYAGTIIEGDIALKGLPDIDSTFFDIQSRAMITNASSIQQIPLYPFDKKEFIELPKQFHNTGLVTFKGAIRGYYHQMNIKGILVTEIGDIVLNTLLSIDSVTNDLNYNGNFKFNEFHFGKFFKQKNVGRFTAEVILNGEGTIFKTMKTNIQANIKKLEFNNYAYKNIIADLNLDKKKFTGDLLSSDENAQFSFTGQINFDNKIPDMNFITSIEKLNLNQLHLIQDTKDGSLSGTAVIKLSGETIDDVSGEIDLNNIQYDTKDKIYYFSNPKIKLKQDNEHHKTFYLHSDFIDLDIEGRFDLTKSDYYINHFMNTFYPSFVKEKHNYKELSKDTFQLIFRIKNFEPISDLLTNKKLFINAGSYLTINYHPKDQELFLNFKSDLIAYEKIQFIHNDLLVHSAHQQLSSVFKISKLHLSDSLSMQDISICSHSRDRAARTNVEWKTFKDTVKYTYNGQLGFSTLFYPHAIYIIPDAFEIPVGKEVWIASQLNPIVIDTALNIDVFPIELTRQNQKIVIDGSLHNNEQDVLKIAFENFELHQLNPLLADYGTHLKGTLNGTAVWHQTLKKSIVSSKVKVKDLYLNNYFIGNIKIYTAYQPLNKSLFLQGNLSYDYSNILGEENEAQLKYLLFEGVYYTDKKDSALDIEIEAKPFNLVMLNPILKDIMTIDYAFLYGKGQIKGTPSRPLISGKFKLTDSKIKTDYLNTYHKIIGNIDVMPDQIRFDELTLYNYGNKEVAGYLNGNIFHNNFSNMRLDFDITAKNLLVLNTNPLLNKEYYGKIYAAGTIGIYGFINNMNIEANLTPKKNSRFTLSFSHAEEVGENSFVRFINPNDTMVKKKTTTTITGLQMNFILNTTQDLQAEVVFNDKTGDGVKVKGEGVIEMNINSFGKFEMNGEYTIRSGTYLFTLESILNKKFEIQEGSTINFIGNPYNTVIDVNANYVQKASLAPLFPYDSTSTYKRRYPVIAQLTLQGKMIQPEIIFNIDVPQVDAATKSKVQLLLSDENELNRQFFSLLLLKSFVTPLQYANTGGVSAGSALAANSSEMLSNRLSSALKGISDFVDIGVNYNPGSQSSSQQMELTMSKQMFNNRLSIDGSFGVNNNQTQNASQIIGDINIEYKLDESGHWLIKGFNRTNNNTQMTISGGPYTQGLGVGYKYEFNSLFNRKSKKKKK